MKEAVLQVVSVPVGEGVCAELVIAPLEVSVVVFGSESWLEGEGNAIFQRPREDLL